MGFRRKQPKGVVSSAAQILSVPEYAPYLSIAHELQIMGEEKAPVCGAFAEPFPDSNRRPPLTMRFDRQRVATCGNGFGLFRQFSDAPHLLPIATSCSHGAP
jgi:hypothetical protein